MLKQPSTKIWLNLYHPTLQVHREQYKKYTGIKRLELRRAKKSIKVNIPTDTVHQRALSTDQIDLQFDHM